MITHKHFGASARGGLYNDNAPCWVCDSPCKVAPGPGRTCSCPNPACVIHKVSGLFYPGPWARMARRYNPPIAIDLKARGFTVDEKINIRAVYSDKSMPVDACNRDLNFGVSAVLFRLNRMAGPRHFDLWTSRVPSRPKPALFWAIYSWNASGYGRRLYWSKTLGWTGEADRDLFTGEERRRFQLPVDGHWLSVRETYTEEGGLCQNDSK